VYPVFNAEPNLSLLETSNKQTAIIIGKNRKEIVLLTTLF
jgi:hypothetical protein